MNSRSDVRFEQTDMHWGSVDQLAIMANEALGELRGTVRHL